MRHYRIGKCNTVLHSHHKKIRKISNCFLCFQNKSGESNTNRESERQHVKSGGLESLFFHKGRLFRNIYFFCFLKRNKRKNKQYMYFQYVNLFECNILTVYEGL